MNKCKNIECDEHTKENRVYCSLKCRNVYTNKYLRDYSKISDSFTKKRKQYKPQECEYEKCSNLIPYEQRSNRFCTKTCFAYATSPGRVQSEATKNKISEKNLVYYYGDLESAYKECQICSAKIARSKRQKFCSAPCRREDRRKGFSDRKLYTNECKFKFSLNAYPDEFDFHLIEEHGWYKPKNKGDNLTGISRDHMMAIMYGFKNNIPAWIIAHPANCRLITQSENSSKREKTIIDIDSLLEKIISWNIKYNL